VRLVVFILMTSHKEVTCRYRLVLYLQHLHNKCKVISDLVVVQFQFLASIYKILFFVEVKFNSIPLSFFMKKNPCNRSSQFGVSNATFMNIS